MRKQFRFREEKIRYVVTDANDDAALLTEFFTPMPVQVTEEEEARAILEYIRSAQLTSQ